MTNSFNWPVLAENERQDLVRVLEGDDERAVVLDDGVGGDAAQPRRSLIDLHERMRYQLEDLGTKVKKTFKIWP